MMRYHITISVMKGGEFTAIVHQDRDQTIIRTGGKPVGFWRSGLRGTMRYWISGVIFGLGYIWAGFDDRRQAWHDKIFDTLVVKG